VTVAEKKVKKCPAPSGVGVPPLPWWATVLLWLVFGRNGGGDGK
jgi:hypothetical protein